MATSPEESKLIKDLYENHKDLISIILEAIAEDESNELSEAERNSMRSINKSVRKKSKTFVDMEIKPGSKIVYIFDKSITATVVDAKLVKRDSNSQVSSISGLAGILSKEHATKNPGSGFEVFTLQGETETFYKRWERMNA